MSAAVLPARDLVLFPGMMRVVSVGRPPSIAAVRAHIDEGEPLVVVPQLDAEEDDALQADLATAGCQARVLRLTLLPDGTQRVLLEGLLRMHRRSDLAVVDGRFQAEVEPMESTTDDPVGIGALAKELAHATEELARMVAADLAEARRAVTIAGPRPRVGFLHNIGRSTPLAGGRNTPAEGMIGFAGGINAFDQFEGHKPVSPEAVIEARPDAIIMTGDAIERFGGLDALVALPHLAGTPAGRNRTVVPINALYILGFGPRIAHAILDLARAIHPGREFAELPPRAWS